MCSHTTHTHTHQQIIAHSVLSLHRRLVGGLASEKVRWAESVERFREEEKTLAGDVLLTSAYLSYVGCFSKNYRNQLLEEKWMPFLRTLKVREEGLPPLCGGTLASLVHTYTCSLTDSLTQPAIPMTENLDVLSLLTDAAKIAQWCNENLPSDRMSIENATILTSAERWPLMIDPQLQGIKWIKTREGDNLKVVRLGVKGLIPSTHFLSYT